MSRPNRNSNPESIVSTERTFFVTSSSANKRAIFQSERAAELFCSTFLGYRDDGRFRVHAFVLMRDHFHALITVDESISIEKAVQFIKGGFAFRAGRELQMRDVWQRGFSEVRITDENLFLRARDYIHHNPVRAHMVALAQDWDYSSANERWSMDPMPQGLKPPH